MGFIKCQYGVDHGRCRCTSTHVMRVECNVPSQHAPKLEAEHGPELVKIPVSIYYLPCPTCARKKLRLEDGWNSYICEHCGTKFTMKAN